MAGFWDDPSVKPSTGEYMKFENVGDSVSGTVSHLGKRTFDDNRVAVEIRFAEDGVPTVTAGQVMLQKALYGFKPVVGDTLSIELAAVQKKGSKTLKLFRVAIARPDGSTDKVDQSA
jgi:hypothetical protein